MMTIAGAILAESGVGNLILILAIFLIGGIGSLSKWFAEQKKERERREEIEQLRRKRLRQQGTMPVADYDDERETFAHETPAPPVAPAPQRVVRRTYRQTSVATETRRPTRAARPPQADGEERVADELQHERKRRQRQQLERQQRLATYQPDEADTAAIQERIVSARTPLIAGTAAGQVQQTTHGLQVNLKNPSAARSAIIMHEILGPPKALQSEQALWEM